MHGGFHPKSSTLRLYASRKEGGRGLVSVEATIQDETSKMHEYIKLKAPTDSVLSECLRQWRAEDTVLEDRSSWEDKSLHGMYHRTITEVADIKKSYQWLERAGLQDSTEALILAAQEQALSTRAIEAQIYHTRQDPRFLGEGSYGKVAKCKKLGTDQVVAIKIIWGSGQMEINALEELSQINADDHNLVKFVESFKYKKYTCIAFEVLDKSLLDFMEKRDFHPLTVEEIRTIAWQLIVALKGLKSVNLVHCDIKLDNIMLVDQVSEPFRVKLIDFGLAEKIGHMRTGATMQNICYRAPEVILGLPLDQSVDLWTVGYILFVLYTGSFIHGWDADYNILRAMVKMQGRLVEDNIPCLDKTKIKEVEQFVDLLKRMLMVDPRKRISPSEALQHPFFTMGRNSQNEEEVNCFHPQGYCSRNSEIYVVRL
uniref:Protein kinase domain-containing protein n=1 Tax=Oryzias latipes TaxID=8090 RepID=A0A3P9JW03_ORYLA